jgi:hypothetical protein
LGWANGRNVQIEFRFAGGDEAHLSSLVCVSRSNSPLLPKLHDKIDNTNLRRGAVSVWCDTLTAIQKGKCFYDVGHDMSASEVDHETKRIADCSGQT